MTTVTVYSTGPTCQRCRLTYLRLESVGIPYRIVDLTRDENAAAREFVTEELGYTEAPVVIVDGQPQNHWSGLRLDLIDRLAAHQQSSAAVAQPMQVASSSVSRF